MVGDKSPDMRSSELQARCLTESPVGNSMLLGCFGCPQFGECGGLHVEERMFDCLDLCCGGVANCTQMCPKAPERFVAQRREIGDFTLDNVPRTIVLNHRPTIDVVELVYHGSKRFNPFVAKTIALRLADLVDFRKGDLKFKTKEQLCTAFKIAPSARLIVSGVDHDSRIEPWWTLGAQRGVIVSGLHALGIELVTAPNFSFVLDVPRADNLHSMKRIALTWAEFQRHGIPCALHVNGRTERDFVRWGRFIAERPEVESLAYEFITGPGLKTRKRFHLDMLASLAKAAGRPLDIVVRGDPHVVPFLRQHFRSVIYIDTTAFVKTMKRKKAERVANHILDWNTERTARGAPLDGRLQHNWDEQAAYLLNTYYGTETSQSQAA